MEQKNVTTEAQEQIAAQREWITPTFERVPLNEALAAGQQVGVEDINYGGS